MKNILILSILGGSLLCGLSPAQDTSTSPASPGAAQPQQDPATTTPTQTPQTQAPETQTSQPSTSQQQQPVAMQPSEAPPTEPQGTPAQAARSPAGAPATSSSPTASTTPKIAPGSVIPVQLSKTIDAKKVKNGDPVVATVTQDMKGQTGQVLVPKDTQVLGHVTEAQPRNKDQKESEVGIAFDHAVIKGDQMNMPMSIQAIIGPQPANPASTGGGDQNGPATAASAPTASPSSSGGSARGGNMGGSTPPPPQNYPQASNTGTPGQTAPRPVINGTTEGVIGLNDLKLSAAAANGAQGSVVTSEKNNVKLDKGTLMLLRVNP